MKVTSRWPCCFGGGLVAALLSCATALPARAQSCAAGTTASNPTAAYQIDSVKGTVTDTRTGLMWDRCAWGLNGGTCDSGSVVALTWQQALALPAAANFPIFGQGHKGYTDWRLPNVNELRSLVEECRGAPAINVIAFPNTPSVYFWSGSPKAYGLGNAWDVDFAYGFADHGGRSNLQLVRLVRAGQ